MSTTASFSAMLKRFMPYQLLEEEMKKRMFFWNKVQKDNGWEVGATLEVPFVGNEASSLLWGALTAANDIAEADYVLGTLSSSPELWGTMLFNEADLRRHTSMEKSYLKILPGKIEQFIKAMAERVSIQLLDDGSVSIATDDGTVGAGIEVARPYLFQIGEKVDVDDDDSALATGYIRTIDINTGIIVIYDARTAGSVVDLSAYTVAQNARIYVRAAQASGMTSLSSQLLSASNGGTSALFGATKASYPHLQARNLSGAAYTAASFTDDILGAFYDVSERGKGNPSEILVSFGNFKALSKDLETSRRYARGDSKSGYGFRSVNLVGPEGDLTVTALRDMPNDKAYIMDWSALKFFHPKNAFERKRVNNEEFFVIRNTTGYQYVVDVRFAGDLVCHQPSHCGVVFGIPTSVSA